MASGKYYSVSKTPALAIIMRPPFYLYMRVSDEVKKATTTKPNCGENPITNSNGTGKGQYEPTWHCSVTGVEKPVELMVKTTGLRVPNTGDRASE